MPTNTKTYQQKRRIVKELAEAFTVLSDAEQRKVYDQERSAAARGDLRRRQPRSKTMEVQCHANGISLCNICTRYFFPFHPSSISFQCISVMYMSCLHMFAALSLIPITSSKLSGCYCQDHARSTWEVRGLRELPWEMWDVWITGPKWTSCVDPPSLCGTMLLYIGLWQFVAFKTRTKVSTNWVPALGLLIWQCVTQSSEQLQFAIIISMRSQSVPKTHCYASKLVNSAICDMCIFDDPSSYFPYEMTGR